VFSVKFKLQNYGGRVLRTCEQIIETTGMKFQISNLKIVSRVSCFANPESWLLIPISRV